MGHEGEGRPGWGRPGQFAVAALVLLILAAIVYWALTNRPMRSVGDTTPPAIPIVGANATLQPSIRLPTPTPTLGPNDVMVYTLDGQEVCSGYPVGNLGYALRCALPADYHLFRVVNQAGRSTLAVRFNEQIVVHVGDR